MKTSRFLFCHTRSATRALPDAKLVDNRMLNHRRMLCRRHGPSDIKGKKSAIGKLLEAHKRGTQSTLHSSDGSINFTLWKDGSSVLFADNDFDASSVANITGKIYNKKKKEFKGRRAYAANDAVRCYRCVHNSVDIHNQLAAYGNWDYRTRRKQMRVPICFQIICRLQIVTYS